MAGHPRRKEAALQGQKAGSKQNCRGRKQAACAPFLLAQLCCLCVQRHIWLQVPPVAGEENVLVAAHQRQATITVANRCARRWNSHPFSSVASFKPSNEGDACAAFANKHAIYKQVALLNPPAQTKSLVDNPQ
jgi:hypothetical protein